MFNVVVRVPARVLQVEEPLKDGMVVLVEGRLNRWSTGTEYDNRQPVTGVEAERLLIIREPAVERPSPHRPERLGEDPPRAETEQEAVA